MTLLSRTAVTLLSFAFVGRVEMADEAVFTDDDLAGYSQTTDAITNGAPAPNDSAVVHAKTSAACVISSRVVLTAAHCIPSSFTTRSHSETA